MNKQHILDEIKRTAKENGGRPLGNRDSSRRLVFASTSGAVYFGLDGTMLWPKPDWHLMHLWLRMTKIIC